MNRTSTAQEFTSAHESSRALDRDTSLILNPTGCFSVFVCPLDPHLTITTPDLLSSTLGSSFNRFLYSPTDIDNHAYLIFGSKSEALLILPALLQCFRLQHPNWSSKFLLHSAQSNIGDLIDSTLKLQKFQYTLSCTLNHAVITFLDPILTLSALQALQNAGINIRPAANPLDSQTLVLPPVPQFLLSQVVSDACGMLKTLRDISPSDINSASGLLTFSSPEIADQAFKTLKDIYPNTSYKGNIQNQDIISLLKDELPSTSTGDEDDARMQVSTESDTQQPMDSVTSLAGGEPDMSEDKSDDSWTLQQSTKKRKKIQSQPSMKNQQPSACLNPDVSSSSESSDPADQHRPKTLILRPRGACKLSIEAISQIIRDNTQVRRFTIKEGTEGDILISFCTAGGCFHARTAIVRLLKDDFEIVLNISAPSSLLPTHHPAEPSSVSSPGAAESPESKRLILKPLTKQPREAIQLLCQILDHRTNLLSYNLELGARGDIIVKFKSPASRSIAVSAIPNDLFTIIEPGSRKQSWLENKRTWEILVKETPPFVPLESIVTTAQADSGFKKGRDTVLRFSRRESAQSLIASGLFLQNLFFRCVAWTFGPKEFIPTKDTCSRCLSSGHTKAECPAASPVCKACGAGHLTTSCPEYRAAYERKKKSYAEALKSTSSDPELTPRSSDPPRQPCSNSTSSSFPALALKNPTPLSGRTHVDSPTANRSPSYEVQELRHHVSLLQAELSALRQELASLRSSPSNPSSSAIQYKPANPATHHSTPNPNTPAPVSIPLTTSQLDSAFNNASTIQGIRV
jgi:hypothetical protein